ALAEAELMARVLPRGEFDTWLSVFLPGIAGGEPATLFTPAVVSDPADGAIAHLHGLNASRAWCWRRIAESLPAGDPRIGPAVAAARTHAGAALPHGLRAAGGGGRTNSRTRGAPARGSGGGAAGNPPPQRPEPGPGCSHGRRSRERPQDHRARAVRRHPRRRGCPAAAVPARRARAGLPRLHGPAG